MSTENMMYNSQMDGLIISEYGRNIQNMIYEVKKMEDDKERQKFAEAIVELMHQMHPTDKNNPESKTKLWRHLFKIANYEIDVTPPGGVIPTPENTLIKPIKMEYGQNLRRFRHYGSNVQELVKMAMEMENGPKKEEFVMIIAAYMKLAYRTWNREHFVSDDVIKQDLESMSNGQIKISEDDNIIVTAPMPSSHQYKRRKTHGKGRRGGSNNYRNKGGGRGNNRKRR